MQNRNKAAISALIMAAFNNILGSAYSMINGPKEIHWITNINLKKGLCKVFLYFMYPFKRKYTLKRILKHK